MDNKAISLRDFRDKINYLGEGEFRVPGEVRFQIYQGSTQVNVTGDYTDSMPIENILLDDDRVGFVHVNGHGYADYDRIRYQNIETPITNVYSRVKSFIHKMANGEYDGFIEKCS